MKGIKMNKLTVIIIGCILQACAMNVSEEDYNLSYDSFEIPNSGAYTNEQDAVPNCRGYSQNFSDVELYNPAQCPYQEMTDEILLDPFDENNTDQNLINPFDENNLELSKDMKRFLKLIQNYGQYN